MLNIHVPTHELHLEAKNCRIAAVVREDKLQIISVNYPHEALAKTHVAAYFDCVVAGERLAKVEMKPFFVAPSTTASECNGVEDPLG
jgi:hypothetical protein